MNKVTTIKPGDRPPALPELDPEHGFDSVRQIISIEPPDPPPPPEPLRNVLLRKVRTAKITAETDPAAAIAELCDLVDRLICRFY